jgi:hypothetical protein
MTPHPISDRELDALLAEHDPLCDVALDSAQLDAALMALQDEIRPRASEIHLRSRRQRRMVFVTGAAVAACAAALASVLSFTGGSGSGIGLQLAVSPAQAAELDRIAHRAAQAAGPGPGQWLYERYRTSEAGGANVGRLVVNTHDTSITQQWTGPTGQQRIRTVVESWAFDTAHDRAVYKANRSRFGSIEASPGQVSDDAMPSTGGKIPLAAQNMPDTPAGIVARFHKLDHRLGDGPVFGADLFGEIVRLLTSSTSQTQRGAALSAIKYVRGVHVLGARRDQLGRPGTAIEDSFNGQITTVIVNEQTGNLLEMTVRDTKPSLDFPAKDAFIQIVYLARAIVGSMTALPHGGHQPYHGPPPTPYQTPAQGSRS